MDRKKALRAAERAFDRHAKISQRGQVYGEGTYLVDPRRELERRDFDMIHEDQRAIANLPTRAQQHEFPERITPAQSFFSAIELEIEI